MTRLIAAVLMAATLAVAVPMVQAQQHPEEISEMDHYEDAFSHPLRLAYYVMYPVGFTIEWLVMRPFHYIVSRPYLNRFFGYTAIGEEGTTQRMGEHM